MAVYFETFCVNGIEHTKEMRAPIPDPMNFDGQTITGSNRVAYFSAKSHGPGGGKRPGNMPFSGYRHRDFALSKIQLTDILC